MTLPTDDKARKAIPIFQGCVEYFPDAMVAIAELSKIANDQHNPGEPLHWAKEKSTDELGSLMRHVLGIAKHGPLARDVEGILEATKVAWRACANLQRLADAGHNILCETPARVENSTADLDPPITETDAECAARIRRAITEGPKS